jgi:hypothetical protein
MWEKFLKSGEIKIDGENLQNRDSIFPIIYVLSGS